MSQPSHYAVKAIAELGIETFGTEKQCEREFNKKVKALKAVAKELGIALWVDEVVVEE